MVGPCSGAEKQAHLSLGGESKNVLACFITTQRRVTWSGDLIIIPSRLSRTLIIYPVESFLVPAMVGNSCWMGRGDDVACRQVGYIISESKRHISVITRKPQAWKHFFSGLRRLYIRADCKVVRIHRDTK